MKRSLIITTVTATVLSLSSLTASANDAFIDQCPSSWVSGQTAA